MRRDSEFYVMDSGASGIDKILPNRLAAQRLNDLDLDIAKVEETEQSAAIPFCMVISLLDIRLILGGELCNGSWFDVEHVFEILNGFF